MSEPLLHVWMPHSSGDAFRTALDSATRPTVRMAYGSMLLDPPCIHVLVEGVPTEEHLDASSSLHTVIVPWSGIAKATCERLTSRPHLNVFNLHHNAASTAESAVALLLAACRSLVPADQALRQGDWRVRYEFDTGMRLAGKTAVVLGMGAIGKRIARTLVAMEMNVVGVGRRPRSAADIEGIAYRDCTQIDALLPDAQVLMVCVPATSETKGMLDQRRLGLLPKGCALVNVARGSVIEESALFEALREKHIAAAGLDVWYRYPRTEEERATTWPSEHPFHDLEHVVLSPHRAGHDADTDACRAEALALTLNAIAEGREPPHRVDLARGY